MVIDVDLIPWLLIVSKLSWFLTFTGDFLRMPAVILLRSATVPRDSRGLHSQDG